MNAVVLNGYFLGLVYGLLAIGLVVVYRGSRVINFAHSEIGMIGACVYTELRTGAGAGGDRGPWMALLDHLPSQLLIGAFTLALCGTLAVLYRYTSFGLRLRCTALDRYAAGLVGIDVNRTSTAT